MPNFSQFLLQKSKLSYTLPYKSIEEIIFTLSLFCKFIHGGFSKTFISENIQKIQNSIKDNTFILLSKDLISKEIFDKVVSPEKNLLFLLKVKPLGDIYNIDNILNNFDQNMKISHIISHIFDKNSYIVEKLKNKIIYFINKDLQEKDLYIVSTLYISIKNKKERKCLLNIEFKYKSVDSEPLDKIQILLSRNHMIYKKDSIFNIIFDISKIFHLDLVSDMENIDIIPEKYSNLLNFMFLFPEKFHDENHIIHYIKKYIEEKEKYHFNSERSKKDKIKKEKNEMEILLKLINKFFEMFNKKYENLLNSESFHFSNPNIILFNSSCIELFKKYLLERSYHNIIFSKSDVYEYDLELLNNIKRNNIFNFSIHEKTLSFYTVLSGRPQLKFSVSFIVKLLIDLLKSKKYFKIKID
ncbi:MAG: hypothetical protein NZZ41_01660 [Candidatus Dojkabacteria bacterium]|nr:hypothetical protein [Candidatus Dojkabacteria bacterium]